MKAVITMLAVMLVLAIALPVFAQDTPQALFKAKCQICHGPDGAGSPAGQKLGAKDLRSPEVQKESDADLFKVTKEGKNKMPKFDGKLTDDQIKDLVKYIRTLK